MTLRIVWLRLGMGHRAKGIGHRAKGKAKGERRRAKGEEESINLLSPHLLISPSPHLP